MATLSQRSSTADGTVESGPAVNWNSTRAGTGLSANTSNAEDTILATLSGANHTTRQAFFDFDTSSLTAGATVSAAVLTLYGNGNVEADTNNTNLSARIYDWSSGGLTTADYRDGTAAAWTGLSVFATFDVGSWNQTDTVANNFTSDAGAPALVSKTATTYIIVANDRIGNSTAPTGANQVATYFADETGTASDPLLTVTYTVVTNVSITSVTATATAEAPLPTPVIAPDSVTATATSAANAPTMNHSLDSVAAIATAAAQLPVPVIAVDSVAATATADAQIPVIDTGGGGTDATVTSETATATATANAPTMDHTLDSVTATATAQGETPTPTVAPNAETATATASAESPTMDHALDSVTATSTAEANAPGMSLAENSVTATASAEAHSPTPSIAVDGITATATAEAHAPGMSLAENSVTATATAEAHAPIPTIEISSETATATAQAHAPTLLVVPGPAEIDIDFHQTYRVRLHLPNVADGTVEIGKTYDLTLAEITPEHAIELGIGNTYALEITMSNETCYVGTAMTSTATFTTVDGGTAVDPTAIQAKWKRDGGAGVAGRLTPYIYGTDAEIVKDSTGVYHIALTADAEGVWTVAWKGTGAAVVVNQDTFRAIPSIFD
jgi:hypothetical protein